MPIERPYGGRVYEFPDDASEEEIFEYLKYQPASGPSAPKIPVENPAVQTGDSKLNMFGRTAARAIPGGELFKSFAIDPVVSAVEQAQQGQISPALSTILGSRFPFLGAGAGSAIGQIAEQSLYGRRPNFGGIAGNALVDALTNKTLDVVGNKVVGGLVHGTERFNQVNQPGDSPWDSVKQMFFERLSRNTDDAAIQAARNSNIPLTTGQTLNNSLALWLEKNLGGKTFKQFQTKQKEAIQQRVSDYAKEIIQPGPPPDLRSQNLAYANRRQMELNEATALGELEDIRRQNVQPLREVIATRTVNDPITGKFKTEYDTKVRRVVPVDYNNAHVAMRQYEPIINDLFGESNMQQLPKSFLEPYKQAKRLIDDVKQTTKILRKGEKKADLPASIKTFRAAQTEIEAIDRFLKEMGDDVPVELSEPKQILTGIRDGIEADINAAIAGWNQGGRAAKARTTAQQISRERRNLFPDPIQAAIKGNPSEFFDRAISNVDEATKAKNALSANGNEKAADELMAEEYWIRMLKENDDPTKWVDKLTKDPVAPVFLGDRRGRLIEFGRAVGNAARQSGGGEAALKVREGGLALTGITSLLSGTLNYAAKRAAVGGSVILGGRQVAKWLMNEKNAKLAARMAKVKPESPEAKFAIRTMMLGLKGQQVKLEIPGFRQFSAFINDDGKLEPSFEDQPEER